jgi:hypothetical protein
MRLRGSGRERDPSAVAGTIQASSITGNQLDDPRHEALAGFNRRCRQFNGHLGAGAGFVIGNGFEVIAL